MDELKKALVVYASRSVTGNSEKVARAVAASLGRSCEISSVEDAPDPEGFAFVAMAFGIYHGWPEGPMRAFMRKCRRKSIGLIITLGVYPDSSHAQIVAGRAEGLLDSCQLKAKFICQGRSDPALVARMKAKPAGAPHSWTPESAKRIEEASRHPDGNDLSKACEIFSNAWQEILNGKGAEPHAKPERKAILLVAFGTASEDARKAYESIEKAVALARPGEELRWAYSSGMVRTKLRKQGVLIPSPAGALQALKLDGYSSIEVLPLYMAPGEEFHNLMRDVSAFQNSASGFELLKVGRPILSSGAALEALCKELLSELPVERRDDDAVVFMGHGNNDGRSDLLYLAAAAKLAALDKRAFLACVEGAPSFVSVKERILALGAKRVFLVPFMIVAGEHAVNDMAGNGPNSWKSLLQAEGIECYCVLRGVGECAGVARLFIDGLPG